MMFIFVLNWRCVDTFLIGCQYQKRISGKEMDKCVKNIETSGLSIPIWYSQPVRKKPDG